MSFNCWLRRLRDSRIHPRTARLIPPHGTNWGDFLIRPATFAPPRQLRRTDSTCHQMVTCRELREGAENRRRTSDTNLRIPLPATPERPAELAIRQIALRGGRNDVMGQLPLWLTDFLNPPGRTGELRNWLSARFSRTVLPGISHDHHLGDMQLGYRFLLAFGLRAASTHLVEAGIVRCARAQLVLIQEIGTHATRILVGAPNLGTQHFGSNSNLGTQHFEPRWHREHREHGDTALRARTWGHSTS